MDHNLFRDRTPEQKSKAYDAPVSREKELGAIDRIFGLVGKQESPMHLWIWGPTGSGKTHCAAYSARSLSARQTALVAHSNCWRSSSLYALVNDVIDQFSILRAELQDTRFKIERIKKHVRNKQCVFIIDEIDRLDAKERNAALYQFHDLSNFWIVAISHKNPLKLGLEPRVWSRLSPIIIPFTPYSADELVRLLEEDIIKRNYPSSLTAEDIRELAEQAAGDAHRAKKLLLQSVVLGSDRPKQNKQSREQQRNGIFRHTGSGENGKEK